MVRVKEPGGDVVRLLVKTVCMTNRQQQQQVPQEPNAAAAAAAAGSADAGGFQVLHEQHSRWLLVSETFCPGIPR